MVCFPEPHETSVLIVDDEPGIRESLTDVLEDEGYRVESVGSGEACLETLPTGKFDVVLLDIWLPGWMASRCWRKSRPWKRLPPSS